MCIQCFVIFVATEPFVKYFHRRRRECAAFERGKLGRHSGRDDGQLRDRFSPRPGLNRFTVPLLLEATQAAHTGQSSLHQQAESLRHRPVERGEDQSKIILLILLLTPRARTHISTRHRHEHLYGNICLTQVKRQPSFSGSANGNGTLRGKSNQNGLGSPKLCPKSLDYESATATLKRNSHGQQHIRADLDQDKYY